MSRRSNRGSPRSKMRMDEYPQHRNGRTKGRSPCRLKELDSVMKKARSGGSQSTYWNKKLLEVEEKDPNRWRHTGYKELYHEERKSRSVSGSRSRSRSGRSRSRSASSNPRTPPARPRLPPPKQKRHSPRSPRRLRSPRPRTPPSKARSPPSPAGKVRSESYSSGSGSSCSDDSCSLCSPKHSRSKTREREGRRDNRKKEKPRDDRARDRERERERVRDKQRMRDKERFRPVRKKATSKTRPSRARSRSESVTETPIEKPKRKTRQVKRPREKAVLKVSRSHYIKVESDSESSDGSGGGGSAKAPRLSLSERFGRMAQWSVDRDMEHRNLRITAGERLTVEMDSPPSPAYPPSLSSLAEFGSWDDVRVRYAYYKEQGYLRDLTLQDYIKWEQWWYKYQDWYFDRYGRRLRM